MKSTIYSIITGTGRFIPSQIIKNNDFSDNTFFEQNGEIIDKSNDEIIEKFRQITDIKERRYVKDEFVTSDISFFAAEDALKSSHTDKEDLNYIIVAHNYGDVKKKGGHSDLVPTIASRVKHKLGIENPYCVAYDLPFGCPGWLQAVIQADYFIKSGDAKKVLVIGAETLSRVSDPHDRDSMIYSDGAGAAILAGVNSKEPVGILAHKSRTDTLKEIFLLKMDKSYNPEHQNNGLFLKMNGRKLYEYALTTVPPIIKSVLDKAGIILKEIKKVIIHQANAKMDEAMLNRLFKLFDIKHAPKDIMPMTISKLGNNSVATLPILYDLLIKNELQNHNVKQGDNLVFASVGAGMNVNAMIYKMPNTDLTDQLQ